MDLDDLLSSLPTEVIDDRETEAQVAIRTYYGYIQAFTIKTGELEQLRERQNDLPAFKDLQRSPALKENRFWPA